MNIMDFVLIGMRRSWRLSLDEASDYLTFDIFGTFNFANREISNPEYIPSPTRAVQHAIDLLNSSDDEFINGTFVDCAAGKGKPCLVAARLGYQTFICVERDESTFKTLTNNFNKISQKYPNITTTLLHDDFLKFDEKSVDTYKEKGYVTFWLFDLRSALPDFFVRATQLCLKWSIANAAILLLSERGLPSFDGWDLITSTDLGYDGSRQIWMYRLKRS